MRRGHITSASDCGASFLGMVVALAWGRRLVRLYPGTAQLPGACGSPSRRSPRDWCGGRLAFKSERPLLEPTLMRSILSSRRSIFSRIAVTLFRKAKEPCFVNLECVGIFPIGPGQCRGFRSVVTIG